MTMQRATTRQSFAVMLIILMLAAPFTAQKKEKNTGKEKEKNVTTSPEVMWRDPGDVASLNLLYGIGGQEHAPDPNGTYTFVSEDLEKLMKGRTSVVIAHRLDTIRHADVIFVIKDSELVEQGTHKNLLASQGVYAELYGIQTPEMETLTPEQPLAS